MLQEIKLKTHDLSNIKKGARKLFSEAPPENKEYFLTECYIKSILNYFAVKGIEVKDGKIYQKSNK